MVVIFVMSRKKRHFQFRDVWDDTHHLKLADDFTNKCLKENNTNDAQGAVVNPIYAPDGAALENPTIW